MAVEVIKDGELKMRVPGDGRIHFAVGPVSRKRKLSVNVVVIEKGGAGIIARRVMLAEAIRVLVDEMNQVVD